MKKVILCSFLMAFGLLSCQKCVKYEKGIITEVIHYGKHGRVLVAYPSGASEEIRKRRPKTADIGKEHCRCIEYQ